MVATRERADCMKDKIFRPLSVCPTVGDYLPLSWGRNIVGKPIGVPCLLKLQLRITSLWHCVLLAMKGKLYCKYYVGFLIEAIDKKDLSSEMVPMLIICLRGIPKKETMMRQSLLERL